MNETWYVKKKRIPRARDTVKDRQARRENDTNFKRTTVLFAKHIETNRFNKRAKTCGG